VVIGGSYEEDKQYRDVFIQEPERLSILLYGKSGNGH